MFGLENLLSYFDFLYMDFKGQQVAERLYQAIILFFAVIGFGVGYYFQQFSYAVGSLALGSLISTVVCAVPWPTYRKHPLKWQKPLPVDGPAVYDESATTVPDSKKKKHK